MEHIYALKGQIFNGEGKTLDDYYNVMCLNST